MGSNPTGCAMDIKRKDVKLLVKPKTIGPYRHESLDDILDQLDRLGYPKSKMWSAVWYGDEVDLLYRDV